MYKRILSFILCFCLCLSLPLTAVAQQQGKAIHIRSVEDLLTLAENCRLDRYSQGKTVYLHCDLDLENVDFAGISTFGGTFEGRGHTICGVEITHQQSVAGFFRYLQPGAVVRDLRISGRVAPGGTAATVGGIVGSNRGLLTNCCFEGSVAGTTGIGGIVGINEAGGCILRCTSQGVVVGENMTGGITGYNMGLVEGCKNQAGVNIYTPDASLDPSNIDLSVLMDPSMLSAGITVMDTGGIAGYSIGSIYDCENQASIGYAHIGYNVGGIVGRSSGTISGCTNYADIRGRKDVGGIVGQMEPHMSLNLDEDHLWRLETQFGELEELIRQLQGSVNDLGAVGTHLNQTINYIDGASDSLEELAGYVGDYGSAMTDEINRASLLLQDALNQMLPALEQAVELGESLESATRTMSKAMAAFGSAAQHLGAGITAINSGLSELQAAESCAARALEQITDGIAGLISGLQIKNQSQTEQTLKQIQDGLQQLTDAADQMQEAARKIAEALQQEGNWDDNTAVEFAEVLEAMADMGAALRQVTDGVTLLLQNLQFNPELFQVDIDSLRAGVSSLVQAISHLQEATGDLASVLGELDRAVGLGAYAMDLLSDGTKQLADSLREMTKLMELIQTAMVHIGHYEPIQLPQLDSGASEATTALFDGVNAISDELRSIMALSETFSEDTKVQLNAIYDKYHQMLSTAMELADQVLDTAAEGLIKDTSDVDPDTATAGKVSHCVNQAAIAADINAGGIAGSMAIDYQLDPEDDLTAQLSEYRLRTYQAKAIIQDCTNLGAVEGKRSYIGGICGRMDLGIIYRSNDFGNVSSAEGDYVGGIAGSAAGIINSCGVKADISGGKYVGGLAGLATAVADSRAMVQLTGREFVGAILGYAENGKLEQITANYYFAVPGTLGAIDGISYDGHAQNLEWDAFLDDSAIGQLFAQAELTFCFLDGTSETVVLPVGTVLVADLIPQLENTPWQIRYWEGLEAQLGQKQYFNRQFQECEKAGITVLESQQSRPDGKPILLLQGSFLRDEKIQLQPLTDMPEALEGWQFTLPADGRVTQIRYAIPEGEQELVILVRGTDGTYHSVSATRIGSYLVFECDETTTGFYVLSAEAEENLLLWIAMVIVAMAIAILIVCRIRRKHKKARA